MALDAEAYSNASLRRLSHEWQLPPWDVLIVGDGSGSGAWHQELGIGWASIVTDVFGNRVVQAGALHAGNVSLAELSAAAHGLWHYDAVVTKKRPRLEKPLRVAILCDNSQIVAESRLSVEAQLRTTDSPQWAFFNAILLRGYVATWHWTPRIAVNLNWAADKLASKARRALQVEDFLDLHRDKQLIQLENLNPLD
jgi:hypothetical protein